MNSHTITIASAICVLLAACSTAPVAPSVGAFAEATAAAVALGTQKFEASDLDGRIADALRVQLAERKGAFQRNGGCEPVGYPADLSVDVDAAILTSCAYRPIALSADGVPGDVALDLPKLTVADIPEDGRLEGTARLSAERNARASLAALGDYAIALADLTVSSDPQDIANSASKAITSLGAVAKTFSTISGKALPKGAEALVSTGSQLVDKILKEALEAKRFAVLSEIVRTADPMVEDLSRSVGIWFWYESEPARLDLYDVAKRELDRALPGDLEAMRRVEAANAAALMAERAAGWQVFHQIGATHQAILKSMDEPASIDELLAANGRIQDFVKAVDAFAQAVEDAGR